MKVYDRDKVLQVAAQLLTGRQLDRASDLEICVDTAKRLIDEVERQCLPPSKPDPTIAPSLERAR